MVLVFALTALAGPPGRAADIEAGGEAFQSAEAGAAAWTLDADGEPVGLWRASISITSPAAGYGGTGGVAPATTVVAWASGSTCTIVDASYACTSWNTPAGQEVSPTALMMDPLGNSATLRATVADQNGTPHIFDVTLVMPQQTQALLAMFGYSPQSNAYYDAARGEAGAAARVPVFGISRSGYTAAGTFDGIMFVPPPPACTGYCDRSYGTTFRSLGATASRVAL